MWFVPAAALALQSVKQILEKDKMIKHALIHNEEVKSVTVHFRRTLIDVLRGAPKVATFTGFDAIMHTPMGLTVRWANSQYFYPATSLNRVKLSK